MRYLLDTHILFWLLAKPDALPKRAQDIIENPSSLFSFSQISIWEAEIKEMSKPSSIPMAPTDIPAVSKAVGLEELILKNSHIFSLPKLGLPGEVRGHKDPFDRMLLAQALSEDMVFLTHDANLSYYRNVKVELV